MTINFYCGDDGARVQQIMENPNTLTPLPYCTRRELITELFSARIEKKAIPSEIKAGEQTSYAWKIKKGISGGKIIGFLEGIPIIGSPIAIISLTSHLIGMGIDQHNQKKNSKQWKFLLSGGLDLNKPVRKVKTTEKELPDLAKNIFKSRVSYAENMRRAQASALSIIPFVKPLFRLYQIYCAPESKALAEPVSNPLPEPVSIVIEPL